MSIPYNQSPFRGTIPCKYAIETKEDGIVCNHLDSSCYKCQGKFQCDLYEAKHGLVVVEYDDSHVSIAPGVYRHFKGQLYRVLFVAENTETSEKYIIYKALQGGDKVYARPLHMFLDHVEDLTCNYRGPRFILFEKD